MSRPSDPAMMTAMGQSPPGSEKHTPTSRRYWKDGLDTPTQESLHWTLLDSMDDHNAFTQDYLDRMECGWVESEEDRRRESLERAEAVVFAIELQENERARLIRLSQEAEEDANAARRLSREIADVAVDEERERRLSFGASVERYDRLVRQDSVKKVIEASEAERDRRVKAQSLDGPENRPPGDEAEQDATETVATRFVRGVIHSAAANMAGKTTHGATMEGASRPCYHPGTLSVLNELLRRRSSAEELVSRGVLRKAPGKAAGPIVEATKHALHRRQLAGTLETRLQQRPSIEDMGPMLTHSDAEVMEQMRREYPGSTLAGALERRPSIDELQQRGVLKAHPTADPLELAVNNVLDRKRREQGLERLLETRPSLEDMAMSMYMSPPAKAHSAPHMYQSKAKMLESPTRVADLTDAWPVVNATPNMTPNATPNTTLNTMPNTTLNTTPNMTPAGGVQCLSPTTAAAAVGSADTTMSTFDLALDAELEAARCAKPYAQPGTSRRVSQSRGDLTHAAAPHDMV